MNNTFSFNKYSRGIMNIAIFGTGMVGEAIGSKCIELGHSVVMGSRTATNEKAQAFVAKHSGKAHSGTFAEAAAFGDIIINCTKGDASVEALQSAGRAVDGKIIMDIANPLDFSNGAPPSLIPSLSNTNSLGEELQKTFPSAKVVKTLNTMWCGLMVNPQMIGGGNHTNFICGNDADAKATVKELLKEFGWRNDTLLDLGDITASRGTEAVLPVWLRIWGATQNGAFNFSIVS
jgi:hypothetical protein